MKKHTVYCLLVLLLFLSACQKQDGQESVTNAADSVVAGSTSGAATDADTKVAAIEGEAVYTASCAA